MTNNYKNMVSVIIPVYNVEKYIEQCINSIINQTYAHLEIIAINDGSTDDSLKILKKLKVKDSRIKIINQKNSGVSKARNEGLAQAKGDYIVFVDADDFLDDSFIEYMLSLIKYNDADFAYTIRNFWSNTEKQESKLFAKNIDSNESTGLLLSPDVTVGCWNKIYKKDFLYNNKLEFLENLYYGEGLNFIIRASLCANKITIGNKKVYYYRKNNMQSATTNYSIDKVYNGENSLILISKLIDMNNKYVKTMYLLHLSTFYLSAIVRMTEYKQKKNYLDDYKNWKQKIKNNLKYLVLSKDVPIYRKLMLIFGITFPNLISKMNKYRNKKIIKKSVK